MDAKLNKLEKKILIAIHRYSYADIGLQELNGYLHFPPIEIILSAVGFLKQEGLIKEREQPFHGYQLTNAGERYKAEHRFLFSGFLPLFRDAVIAIVASAIGGIIAARFS